MKLEQTLARCRLYYLFAVAFSQPRERFQSLSSAERLTELIKTTVRQLPYLLLENEKLLWALEEFKVSNASDELKSLEREYNRLFVSPGCPAPPYESVYRDERGLVMGPWATETLFSYAQEGLSISSERKVLPDHIVVELEYMAHLCDKESEARSSFAATKKSGVTLAKEYREKQRAFLLEHLCHWLPLFCYRILQATGHPFYAPLAIITEEYLLWDVAQINKWEKKTASTTDVSKVTDKSSKRGFWSVIVKFDLCTLCGVCTEVCREKAIKLSKEESFLRLIFESAECSGCVACVRFCPEGALSLKPSSRTIETTGEVEALLQDTILSCPICNRPTMSQKAMSKILQRLKKDERISMEKIETTLMRCANCRMKRMRET